MSGLLSCSDHARLPLPLRLGRWALLLGLLTGSAGRAWAIEDSASLSTYVQTVVDTSKGLPQDSVRAIVQGTDNLMWFGTEEGFARYDGVRAVTYDRNNTPAIRDNNIHALTSAPDGSLWIASQSGVTHFANGRVLSSFKVANINSLFCGPTGQLWLGTDNGLLTTTDGGQSFHAVPQVQTGTAVRSIASNAADDLWLLTDGGVLHLTHGHAHLLGKADGIAPGTYKALTLARDGSIWLAGPDHLFHWAQRMLEEVPLTGIGEHPVVNALLQDKAGSIWAGFAHNGVAKLRNGRLFRYTVDNGLPSNEVAALQNDRSGNVWVGLTQGGTVSLHEGLFRTTGEREGLANSMVWATLAAHDGSIWAGTNTGGLDHLLVSGQVKHFSRSSGVPAGSVLSLFQDRDSSIWAGLDTGDLVHITQEKVHVYRAPMRGSGPLRSIVRGPGGDLYVFYKKISNIVRFEGGHLVMADQRPQERPTFAASAADGSLWIGSEQSGVTHWNGAVLAHFGPEQGLPSDFVTSITVEPSGLVWVATTGGISLIRNGKVTQYTPANGLFSYTVGSVLEDNAGYLWLSSNKGISKLKRQELLDFADGKVQQIHGLVYGTVDGMRTAECNYGTSPSASRAPNGTLWYSTPAGVVAIDPVHSIPYSGQPQAHIEAITVDGKTLALGTPIELSKGTHDVQVDFTAPDFIAPNRLRFRYKLDGFDRDWVDAGSRRQAFYTHLPPGKYTLLVQAEDGRGWPLNAASLAITVPPHFWETGWFLCLCMVCVTLAGYGVYNMRVYALRRRGAILQECVTQRTIELQSAISIAEEAQQKLRDQATRDSLTRLWNRRQIFEMLQYEAVSAEKEQRNLCVLMLDVDHFKRVNDTAGHLAGDCVLENVGAVLVAQTMPYDYAGRYGGEEFLLVLRNCTLEGGIERAETVRAAIESMRVKYDGMPIPVTASCGVAELKQGSSIEFALKEADRALYRAKQTGRNRVCTATESPLGQESSWFDQHCGYAL